MPMKIANWKTLSEISCHSLRLSINLETQVDDAIDYFLQILLAPVVAENYSFVEQSFSICQIF